MVLKERYLEIFQYFMKVFNGCPCKLCHKIFLHIFLFQNIPHLFLFSKKKLFWLRTEGWQPAPFTDWSFFTLSLTDSDLIGFINFLKLRMKWNFIHPPSVYSITQSLTHWSVRQMLLYPRYFTTKKERYYNMIGRILKIILTCIRVGGIIYHIYYQFQYPWQ